MNIFKKHIALIGILCMLLNVVCIPAFNVSAEDATVNDVNFLTSLGIYSVNDEMDIANEPLTREMAASILSVFYGVRDEAYPTKTIFEDVSEYWASGHIMTMVNNGVMSGYDDGLFRPTAYISANEAVKMLITMLGRDVTAELKGGYPHGYILEAQQCGMLKGVTFSDGAITKGEFTTILVNSLDVSILEQTAFGEDNNFSYAKDKTLLSDKLNIYIATGTVNSTDYASISYDKPAPKGKVLIGGKLFNCGLDAYKYLASNVRFYYYMEENDSVGEILYIEEIDSSNIIDVDAKDISDADAVKGTFAYAKNNKVKKLTLPSDLVVIFNGKRITYYNDNHLNPQQGRVRLVMDGSTVKYMIVDYEINYIVDTVSAKEDLVYISDLNGKVSLKCDIAEHYIKLTDNGAVVDIKKLKKGDVLSVVADSVDFAKNEIKQDSTVFRIIRSSNNTTGALDMLGDNTAVIDGKEYDLSADAQKSNPQIGNLYTAYLNYNGEIVYFGEVGSEDALFGIIHKHSVQTGLTDKVQLKIYTQEEEMIISEVPENITIDGVRYKDVNLALDAIKAASNTFVSQINSTLTGTTLQAPADGVWQLVKFKMNDKGVIKYIDTIVPNAEPGENDLTLFKSRPRDDSTRPHVQGIYTGSGSVSGEVGYSDDTIFFETGAGSGRTDNSYRKFVGKDYTNRNFAFLAAFCANDMNVCDMILRVYATDISATIDSLNSSSLMLFDKAELKLADDGTEEMYASGYFLNNGAAASIAVADESVLAGIERGDFIRYATGSDGKITMINHFLDISNPAIDYSGSGRYSSEVRVSYGTAIARDDDYLLTWFDVNNDGIQDANDWYEPRRTNYTTNIFLLDKRTGKLSKATLDDICTEKVHGVGDTVGAFYTSSRMPTIVIYRN